MLSVNIKYRTWNKGIPPRPIKLEIPGWAGQKHWNSGQPHHCKPFIDGATYGLELIYPYDTEVTVIAQDGVSEFLCNSKEEWKDSQFPFQNFAPNHFGFTSSLDIQTEEGIGTMILPHPRYYTDMKGDVPLPVHGLIESDWWPKIFFLAFRAPLNNQKYIFRQGEGFAHLIFVPKEVEYNIHKMTSEEEKQRKLAEQTLSKYGQKIATRVWKDEDGQAFDNKYKVLSGLAKKKGAQFVAEALNNIEIFDSEKKTKDAVARKNKMKRRLIK